MIFNFNTKNVFEAAVLADFDSGIKPRQIADKHRVDAGKIYRILWANSRLLRPCGRTMEGLDADDRCRVCGANLTEYNTYQCDKKRRWVCKECRRMQGNKEIHRLKIDVITNYGGKCECCGETKIEFLTIDHRDNDGAAHRKKLGKILFYRWLRRMRYPKDGFRLLCINCNFALGMYGYCPHQKTIQVAPIVF